MAHSIRRFLFNTLCFLVLLFAAVLSYRHLFHGHVVPVLIAAVFLLLYGLASAAGVHGTQELKKYEQIQTARGILPEDHPKLLLYAMSVTLPLHFCIFLASFIPITTYEVWFVTIFPCLFILFQPIRAVCDVYTLYTGKKGLFWVLQLLVVLAVMLPPQMVVQTFL